MGRPLNKKYFGNRNVGSNGYGNSDDFIGGEGISALAVAGKGSVRVTSTNTISQLVVPTPTIPGGTTATFQVVWEIESVTINSAGTNYTDTLPTDVTFTGLAGVVGRLTAVTGGNGLQTISFSAAGANRGEFINPTNPGTTYEACTAINISGGGDNGQVYANYRVKRIEVLTAGSGYTGTESFSWTTSNLVGTEPDAPTATLTADSGGQYQGYGDLNVDTYQENAILITAKTTAGGTAQTGDIVKQSNARSYKVKTSDGTAVCKLVAKASPAVLEATINATDSAGGTYYVTKLTAHKALLTRNTGTQFATGQSVKWTFGSAVADSSVTIDNA